MTAVTPTFAAVQRRIKRALFAQMFVRVVRVAEQLILIPLLLSSWGVQSYGEWLAIGALAGFAAIVNLGIGHAAAAEIVLQFARSDLAKTSRVFMTSMVFTTATIILGILGFRLVLALIDVRSLAGLPTDGNPVPIALVMLLAAATLVPFLAEPLGGALAAIRGAALPNSISAISKTIELLCIGGSLYAGSQPLAVAGIMLAGAMLNIVIQLVFVKHLAPWLSFSWSHFDRDIVAQLWRPAMGFFVIFVCVNIISVYVPRLLVSSSLGPVALATFSVLVTYTKTARNLSTMTSQAIQVEIGRVWANGDMVGTRYLVTRMLRNAILIAAIALVGELILAPAIIPRWTNGHIAPDWALMSALALVALIGCYLDGTLLAGGALNEVGPISLGYAAGLVLAIGGAMVLLPWTGSLAVMGACLILPEIGGSALGWHMLKRLTGNPRQN